MYARASEQTMTPFTASSDAASEKQKCAVQPAMSALGQERTFNVVTPAGQLCEDRLGT